MVISVLEMELKQMRVLINNHNEEVKDHLRQEFGNGNFDECCGVVAPTYLTSFRVEEVIQTGKPQGFGVGPTEISPGDYQVDRGLEGGCSSHGMILQRYGDEKPFYIEVGFVGDNGSGHCIDWRGVKKIPCRDTGGSSS